MSRRLELFLITLLLLLAAYIRINELSRLPAGFNGEEIANLRIAESVGNGSLGVFYNLETPGYAGHESTFPLLERLVVSLTGDGFLGYRLLPMLSGLLSVALVYALARRLYGSVVAFVAAFLFTVGLWPVLLSRLVLSQAFLLPVYLGALLAFARAIHLRQNVRPLPPETPAFTALGVLLALSVYTHYTGLVLVFILIVFMIYLRATLAPISKRARSYTLYAFLLAAILGIPYLTSTARATALSGIGAFWLQRPDTFWKLFVNVYALGRALLNPGSGSPVVSLVVLILGAFMVVGLVGAGRGWRKPGNMLILLMFGSALFPAIWTGRGDYNLAILYPAVAILIGVGVRDGLAWARNNQGVPVRRLAGAGVALLGVWLFAAMYSELFQRWPTDMDINRQFHGYLGSLAVALDRTEDTLPTLVCVNNLTGNDMQPTSDPVLMEMMLRDPHPNLRFSDCDSAIVVADGGKTQRVAYNLDRDGQVPYALRDWLGTSQKKLIEVPGLQRAMVYEVNSEREVADAMGKLNLSYVNWPPDSQGPHDAVKLPARMGNYLTFEGYNTDEGRHYKPGDIIPLSTYWRIDAPQQDDLRLFTHLLLDPGSSPVVQVDALDVAPSFLQDRDIVMQVNRMQLPYPFSDGEYYLSVGAYHDDTKARVPVYDENDQVRGDRLFLGSVRVKG